MHGVNNWYMVFTCHYYQSSLFLKCNLQPVMKCLWSIVMSVCGYLCGCITVWFHWNCSLWVQFHLDVHIWCAQNLSVAESRISACALILCTIPGCQRKGQAYSQGYTHCGQKGSDGLGSSSAVRTPGGFLAGLGHYSQGHPTHRGPVGSPPCSVSSWVDGCAAPLPRSRLDRCDDAVK